MPNEKFTQLPIVANSTAADIICAVQGGISTQQTLSQVMSLIQGSTILSFAGDPNGNVAGTALKNFCWDTVNSILYICTTTGTALTAVWTQTSVNGIVTPTEGGTGVSNPTEHGIAVAEGASDFTFLTLTNGQLLIGSTGNDPVPAALTAGVGIAITNSAGSITIDATGPASFVWEEVTGTSQSMVSNTGYIANNVALVTLTLPTLSAVGDLLEVVGKGAGGWLIAQNAGQTIHLGNTSTTTGAGGSLASTDRRDAIYLVCTAANTEWTVGCGPQGNITVV